MHHHRVQNGPAAALLYECSSDGGGAGGSRLGARSGVGCSRWAGGGGGGCGSACRSATCRPTRSSCWCSDSVEFESASTAVSIARAPTDSRPSSAGQPKGTLSRSTLESGLQNSKGRHS